MDTKSMILFSYHSLDIYYKDSLCGEDDLVADSLKCVKHLLSID